jgi:hypothetical protein
MHSIMPNERKGLSLLSCINASDVTLPIFYMFKGTHLKQNFIAKCELNVTTTMQPKAWMIPILFDK